ncbi:MAG: 2Fe-2S iron-sulfur cluster-binding protein [Mucilaginibacter sp.]
MLQLRVEAVKQELQDAATFYLSEVSDKKIPYKAGQFITLVFDHHHEEIRRSYSLSSSPDEQLMAITVKRIPNGEISRFMLTKVKPGDILHAEYPAGRFTFSDSSVGKAIFLFAAGSGIVPIFSQLKYALSTGNLNRFILIYSNRDSNSVLFDNELQALAEIRKGVLTIINLLSSEANRLTNYRVEQLVKQYTESPDNVEFYLCGPFDYMRMIRLTLIYMGIEPQQIRKENFVLDTIAIPASPANFPPKTIRIHFGNETYDLVTGENQSILQAALQNGIKLPFSCQQGICSACTATCKSGKVVMTKNDVLTDIDLALGLVLTCTGHAVSDGVVIEV